MTAAVLGGTTLAQQPAAPAAKPPARPTFETTKVEGTDNVYVFRYLNRQAMFIVTPAGVIATDPIGYGFPETGAAYLGEIRKVTNQPVKYVIYSHHHFDHIAGGKPFKDAGATFIAHKKVKERLALLKDPNTVLPDETFEKSRTIKLGGTVLELTYHGLNHSDSTIVMLGPGREGNEAAQIREHARLCEQHAVRAAALLRAVGSRHLSRSVSFYRVARSNKSASRRARAARALIAFPCSCG